ncbi:MAG: DUF4864 domain-containing protein [Planctomycetes bacterium]|nr:DUF4864 domain-containing protein [Planctomycetota bacterium]
MSDSSAPGGPPQGSDPQLNDTLRPASGSPLVPGSTPPPSQFHVGQSSSGQILIAPGFSPAFPIQDLTVDPLLTSAPRVSVLGRNVPSLDGIPILHKLGQGGMGAVYYAYHPRLDREVAVKVLPQQLAAQNPELVQRFFREARIAAKIHSPHLVGVLDVDQDGGLFFIVMEFVRGGSVRGYLEKLKKQGRVGTDEVVALDVCIAAALGLAEAHARGVVHRDVKPDNILLPMGAGDAPLFTEAKVADLGLARGEGQDTELTMAHSSMGTPGYLAPEQATDAHTAAPPADVYGLGASLYAMLAGQAPFTGTSAMRIMMDTVQKMHTPIRSVRPDISADTSAVIDRSLAKDPAQRFANAGDMVAALSACRAKFGHPSVVTGAITAVGTAQGSGLALPVPPPLPSSSAPAAVPPPRPSGLTMPVKVLLGCVGLSVLMGGLVLAGLLLLGLKLNANMVAPIEAQLQDLKQGNIDAAYEKTSKEFRQATSRTEFERFVKTYVALSNFESVAFSERQFKNSTGTVKGAITATDKSTSEVEYVVVDEDGAWRIQNIRIRGPLATDKSPEAETTPGQTRITALTTGTEADERGLLKSSKVSFTTNDGTIYLNAKIANAVAGSRITAALSQAGGTLKLGPVTQQITQEGSVVSLFNFSPPSSGWPKGRYEVSVYISGGASSKHTFYVR